MNSVSVNVPASAPTMVMSPLGSVATAPMPLPTGWDRKVMHAALKVGDMHLMLSDADCTDEAEFRGFRLSLTLDGEAAARRAFDKLAEGGSVQMPLAKTFWSPLFGMLEDKFGIGWMIGIDG